MSDEVVLSVRNLKKKIGKKWIIRGVSFDVKAGEVFGFLGPNGAGKTTTIRMLVNLIKPTEGRIEIAGYDVQRQHNLAMRHIGCIVENPELYPYLTGYENLEHFARMIPGVGEKRIREVTAIVGMDQRIHDKVKTYSLGMRQRLGIAQALLSDPKLLILDEPTNGLDPQGIKEMRLFIRELARGGLSLFVSSHLLSEVQQLCDRVAIISHGEVIEVGGVQELLGQQEKKVLWTLLPAEQGRMLLEQAEEVELLQSDGETPAAGADAGAPDARNAAVFAVRMDPDRVPALNAHLVQNGVQVCGIEIKSPSLEDLFLSMTEGERID